VREFIDNHRDEKNEGVPAALHAITTVKSTAILHFSSTDQPTWLLD
jgi:hypothetical protein